MGIRPKHGNKPHNEYGVLAKFGRTAKTTRSYNVATIRKVATINMNINEEEYSPELLARVKEYDEQKKNGTLKTMTLEEFEKSLDL